MSFKINYSIIRLALAFLVSFFFFNIYIIAQDCPNVDFSDDNYTNWTGKYGTFENGPPLGLGDPVLDLSSTGFITGRFTIITAQGTDPNTTCSGPGLSLIPPGYNQSLKIGTDADGGDYEAESVSYSLTVDATNDLFTYDFAVVLQDPGHPANQQPFFEIAVLDQAGDTLPCTKYYVAAGASISGFQSCGDVRWRNWTKVGVDLSSYMGQTITITATVAGCSQGAHYGYAYLVANCQPLKIDVDYCMGSNIAILTAPDGFDNYQWSTGATTQSITVVNPQVNNNQVTCTVSSVLGCTATMIADMHPTIITPALSFNVNGCDDPVSFTDLSTTNNDSIIGWNWHFGDGDSSSAQNPTHTYASPGTYNVTLNLTSDPHGCSADTTFSVVIPPCNANVTATGGTICLGDSIQISAQGTPPGGTYSWSDGAGNDSAVFVKPTTTTTYTVTYTSPQNVTGTAQCTVTINPLPTVTIGSNSPICENTQLNLTSGGGTNYSWSGPNGFTSTNQNPTIASATISDSGIYKVVVTDSNGCVDSSTISVIINPAPNADFASIPACPGTATQFNDSTTITTPNTYSWDFGDGTGTSTAENPTYIYNNGGTYNVKLTVISNNGCVDSIIHPIIIPYLPIAAFSFDTACVGTQTCFTDLSTVQNSTIAQWTWSWGDGEPTGTQQNPCHTYATAGTYTVIMTPTSADGCVAANPATHQITVEPFPTADFTVNNVCQYDAASFVNTSVDNSNNLWDFGDGDSSNQINPTHQYSSAGTYQVKLTATTSSGCEADTTIPVTIYTAPIASFTSTNVCEGLTMPFTDNSTGGTITGWSWHFGDGNSSTTQNPTHTYSGAGNYQVSLITTTSDNCVDSITKTVVVYPLPTADFSQNSVCVGTPTSFMDNSTVNPGSITGWQWIFGGTPIGNSTQQNPAYTFNSSGTFNVQLIVQSNHNCVDSITKQVTVNPNPVVNFGGINLAGCTPWCAQLTDSSNVSTGQITNWEWNLGNGTVKDGENVTACYENDGLGVDQYNITLTVTTDKGCKDSITKTDYISIYPHPKAIFTTSPKIGDTYHTTIHFLDESQGAATWDWALGDGDSSTVENPIHDYGDTGTYVVWLKVTNQWGCKDSVVQPIRIRPIFSIYIPNAFTPNGDGINDFFFPKSYGVIKLTMYIFNRWGQLLYTGKKLNSKWDGIYKGVMVPNDVYVYRIIATDFNNKTHSYIGSVTVVR